MAYRRAFVVRIPRAVMPLIGINIFMFLLQIFLGTPFTDALVLNSATVFSRPWTLITSMFLHGGFSHLLFNMYALLMFGPLIEQKVGTKRFLEIYFLSGILAGLGFVAFRELIVGVSSSALGASGAIMGILGMTIMLLPQLRVLFFFVFPMSMRTAGIIFALIDFVGLFNPNSSVANIAHLVGLATGLLYATYLLKEKKNYYHGFARPYSAHKEKKDYGKTIELSEDDVKEYLKKGRL
ncbi:MAG: rhomboid family intramembrane serine protease [Nanoarchaeota archaeon]|nr:rhomboid family intramembrane serine protease [Nanoarchaeota archaeon]